MGPFRKATFAAAILVGAIAAGVLLPAAIALAAGDDSYAGTYAGIGTGKNKKGKKGSSGATVWVEDLGSTTRLTFRFDKLPVVVDIEGAEQATENGFTVPISVNKMGIRGSATITFSKKGENWQLVGRGSGKALKYEGTGILVCTRTSTGVALPSTGQQFNDLFDSLSGGTPASSKSGVSTTGAGGGGAGSTSGKPVALVVVKPVSALAPAKPKPPVSTDGLLAATGVAAVALAVSAAVGFSKHAPVSPSGEER